MGNEARSRGDSPRKIALCKGKGAIGQNDRLECVTAVEYASFELDAGICKDDGLQGETVLKDLSAYHLERCGPADLLERQATPKGAFLNDF